MTASHVTPAYENKVEAEFGYVFGLDALRLAAVAVVIAAHFEMAPMIPGGFGVSVFFFISGFLITRLLLAEEKKNGRIRLTAFYIRRFIRLLPPLILLGAIAVPLLFILRPEDFSWTQVILSFTYLGNLMKPGVYLFGWPEGYDELEPLWSLAVEEHFYLLLPAGLLFVRKLRSRIALMVSVIFLALLTRIILFEMFPVETADQINYHFTLTRADALAFGVLLTLLLEAKAIRRPSRGTHTTLLVAGGIVAMLLSLIHWNEYYEIVVKYTVQSAAIGVAFLGVIFGSQARPVRAAMEWQPVVHLGRISYELYLWHFPVLALVATIIDSKWLTIVIALGLTVLVAELAYRLTTRRLRAVRRRFGGHPVS